MLVLSADILEIKSADVSLGLWKCTEIDAARSDGNWFRLHIDDEDWRFLPDNPTDFLFNAIPVITAEGSRRRSWKDRLRTATPDLGYLGRIALGAVLAVLLLSVGMLMGRYRLDDSSVAVLAVSVAAAASGGWWTAVLGKAQRHEDTPKQNRRPVSPLVNRSALSVREAMAQADGAGVSARRPERGRNADAPARGQSEPEAVSSAADGPDTETASAEERRSPESDFMFRSTTTPLSFLQVQAAEDGGDVRSFLTDERASAGEPPRGVDPSTTVAELLHQTADDAKPNGLFERPDLRARDRSPIDLTVIKGVGPTISAALTRLGVTDVRDLATLGADDMDYLEQRLGRFASPKRTRQWIAQAQRIVDEEDTHRIH